MKTELKNNEKVVLEIRPHWFTLVMPVSWLILGIAAAILIGSYGYIIPVIFVGNLVYKILQRNNNLWAVTNVRVVDEYGVFSLNSKESPLDKINNVSYSQSIWGRMFGYGNVQIQTAAEIGSSTYHLVEKPKELKDMITKMQEEYKNAQVLSQAQEFAKAISSGSQTIDRKDVSSELEKLFELKQKGILTEDEFNLRKRKILEE